MVVVRKQQGGKEGVHVNLRNRWRNKWRRNRWWTAKNREIKEVKRNDDYAF